MYYQYVPAMYPLPHYAQVNPYTRQLFYQNSYVPYDMRYMHSFPRQESAAHRDHGKQPYVVNIEEATKQNNTFRTAIWTGDHLQVTLMSIGVGDNIGLEIHPHVDQFLRIEDGEGFVQMGKTRNRLTFQRNVADNFAIMVPAGTWHNVTNTGDKPLKLYSIYAPPNHPFGTVHRTKADAMKEE
ncbi:cupin domain-containing protein [Oceanobacillus piezotolerans]|uniref:Cupin domain-containing protein n=2 Tax=Oceanobacillus piezotolerans TaxID=2448030 RepID=A0A498DRQ3_9BACI|nr:cupin domain-containing protein [Oceanobacillus piezotolerans]RLL47119.1 cupin domain-containing protein [Oceanobacillus piezotolerans]